MIFLKNIFIMKTYLLTHENFNSLIYIDLNIILLLNLKQLVSIPV